MFDLGWTEMALIAVVAVVVIGPKELPKVMREVGQWVGRARALSRDFMDQLEQMSRDTGLDEVRKDVQSIGQIDVTKRLKDTVDPDGLIERQAADLAKIGMPLEPPLPTTTAPVDAGDFVPPEEAATQYVGEAEQTAVTGTPDKDAQQSPKGDGQTKP